MKFLFLTVVFLFSAQSLADCKNVNSESGTASPSDIDLNFIDRPVSEVVTHINSMCGDYIEPIEVNNPNAEITMTFEVISCIGASAIVKDFDNSFEET